MRAPRWLLAPVLGSLLTALAAPFAYAQSQSLVVRDGTLGSGDLEVGPGIDSFGRTATYWITPEMGEQHEGNLFHSFASFSIRAGEVATFAGPDPTVGPQSISNVISRVTGGDPSQIDGTLRSDIPGANLWLLNPSGVVFGAGAQLDVSGSFHASTSDSLGFGADGLERFQVDRSLPSVLSTAAPTAFGFLPESAAASLDVDGARLVVPYGETLELVASRDVSLTSAEIVAPGGHVSLEAQREIALVDSLVDAGGDIPGSVSIRAGRVVIEQGSHVLAENTGNARDSGGAIRVAALESVVVDDSLLSVSTSSAGDAGTIHVESPEVTFRNGPGIPSYSSTPPGGRKVGATAETGSSGAGGTIEIDAGELRLENGVVVRVAAIAGAAGHAGTIQIRGGSASLSDSSLIGAGAYQSMSHAGSIRIHLTGTLTVDGAVPEQPNSHGLQPYALISAGSGTGAKAPGRIEIEARRVEILNGGEVDTGCYTCRSKLGDSDRSADAGSISITADSVVVAGHNGLQGARLVADGYDGGDAGAIDIDADSVELGPRGRVAAAGFAGSNAGTITIHADDSLSINQFSIEANTTGAGKGGAVKIEAGALAINAGGGISVGTSGIGNAGSVTIRGESVRIGRENDAPPGLGGFIAAGSSGPGAAGTIDIAATDSIFLTHTGGNRFSLLGALQGAPLTGVFSAATGRGSAGGSIRLAAPEITVTDGAIVSTSTVGGGRGGSIDLRGDRILIRNGGFVDTTSFVHPLTFTPGGDAGSVTLEATDRIEVVGRDPVFGDVSRVASTSTGSGKAGDVVLRAPHILIDEGVVATTAVAFATGQQGSAGGSITIRAGDLVVANGGQVNASTFIAGPAGSIDVVGQESILVTGEGSGIESRTGGAGAGGDVSLTAPRIAINDGGEVSARSERGVGGLADFLASALDFRLIRLPPAGAAATGDAGAVSLDAQREVRLDRGTIATNAEADSADGGNVTIRANDLLYLDRSVITASVTGGDGGNITIDPDFVILQNGSRIEASAGAGVGGQIQITTNNFLAFPGSVVTATAGNPELSGTVEIHSPDVNLAGTLNALTSSLLDAASLMHERCAARRTGERAGSFAMRGPGGIPAEPDGWLRAPMLPVVDSAAAEARGRPALVASLPGAQLMDSGCP